MAEENHNNQGVPGTNAADDAAKSSKTTTASANSVTASSVAAATTSTTGAIPPKKPKTEKQIVRERERRRRRRKKKAEIKGLVGNGDIDRSDGKSLRPGDDVPLLAIKEDEQSAKLQPPADSKLIEAPFAEAENEQAIADVPLLLAETDAPEPPAISAPPEPEPELEPVPVPEPQPEPKIEPVPVPEPQPEPKIEPEAKTEPESEPQPEVIVIAEPDQPGEPLEHSQEIFEENPGNDQEEKVQESDSALPENDNLIEAEPLVHEDHFEKANQDKARELHESLITDKHDHLEELPVKQGLMGKLFDKFAELIQGRKTQGLPSSMSKKTETIVTEVSTEKPDVSGISSFLANLIKFVLVVVLVIGAFWLGSSLKVMDRIGGLLAGGKPGEQLEVGDNSLVVIDPEMIRKWGFETARLIGSNLGDNNDLTYNIFFNANYFGRLKDPIFYGETGISAAIYYGFGKEIQFAQNRFIAYVQELAAVVNANSVRLEDVLKSNTRRDIALDNYLIESQEIFDQGNTLRKEINVQIDDLKVSINTLAPDKLRYETDFFASMALYDGEKANALLAKFIEAGQKNIELTAKQNALQKLTQNYEINLLKLKTRIQAVEANRDALISGVTVTEIPGGGLNLIKQ